MSARHTPATARIQRRLERLELEHLRTHAVEQAERIELLETRAERLERDVYNADSCADMWRDACMRFEGTLDGDGVTLGLGLTMAGEVVRVRTVALQ